MAQSSMRTPSSISAGFFQSFPKIKPAYTSSSTSQVPSQSQDQGDPVFKNILKLYLPSPLPESLDKSFHDFARTCLDPTTIRLAVESETNHPTLHQLNTFGERNDINPLVTSEGWRGLKDIQTKSGIVAHGYRDISSSRSSSEYNRRIHQFALTHMWSPACASVSCPAAMSDGAAILLKRHLERPESSEATGQDPKVLRKVLTEAYERLTSFDPTYAWTSGQWMTERPGGSDVSRTETLARLARGDEVRAEEKSYGSSEDGVGMPLGPWLIDGFKWFSSATDADMVVLLAQTEKGLSAFYAPMRRTRVAVDGAKAAVMNGVRISRLKNKLGTKGLPTAELEIGGMRAWLLGEEGRGVREIAAILNATRLWTAVGATGSLARGLAVSRSYSSVRTWKGGQALAENRQHVRWMANETVKYRASTHLAFLGVMLLGISEQGESAVRGTVAARWLPQDKQEAYTLLRLLTPIMKAQCSSAATLGLREVMESLGGVGYCENNEDGGLMNVARLLRDCSVNNIWEGTTNILAEDFVRASRGKTGTISLASIDRLLKDMVSSVSTQHATLTMQIKDQWQQLHDFLQKESETELLYHGKQLLQSMYDILCAVLLLIDATNTKGEVEQAAAKRWVSSIFETKREVIPSIRSTDRQKSLDDRIFFGKSKSTTPSIAPKL